VRYYMEDREDRDAFLAEHLNDLCASVSEAITEVLVKKLRRAVEYTGVDTIALAGGVSANSMLRRKTKRLAGEMDCRLHIPKSAYCTDNAAMIAVTGHMMGQRGRFSDMTLTPFAKLANVI
ncbi:MAG TPA: hypothetical protein VK074_09200, partial [Fodinibius sp.]|nr:hypothetical protein [Fodinibius sp.]